MYFIERNKMSLRCGLIGLPSCGKTVIFNAITAAGVSSYNNSRMNEAIVNVPDRRLEKLAEMYHPLKTAAATLDVIDIPGIEVNHPGEEARSSPLLGHIKDVEALLHVVRCFEDSDVPLGHDTVNPVRDVETAELELMAADSVTLQNKINRLAKKVRAGDKDAIRETDVCTKIYAAIQEGIPGRKQVLSSQEMASIRECNLVSLKPVLYVANIKSMEDAANSHVVALNQIAQGEGAEMIIVSGKDEADISQLEPDEQQDFLLELGLQESTMERLIHSAYRMLGLVTFFTTGEDEVRAWTCRKGDKAPVAAGKIHTDMEKGFIRMEVIRYDDLIELGSEAAVAKTGRERLEGREYEVQDGDIVSVRFNGKG
ncbi:MAG: redox-regulated ATPase YchF [Dehalococcoidales bacterium]|nr:redox-regulated ATPase YchF [Dehalococcoidales bacterium]